MPHKEVDDSKTHFYKIVCKDLSIKDCYVGHTTNFKNRKMPIKENAMTKMTKSITISTCINSLGIMEGLIILI